MLFLESKARHNTMQDGGTKVVLGWRIVFALCLSMHLGGAACGRSIRNQVGEQDT